MEERREFNPTLLPLTSLKRNKGLDTRRRLRKREPFCRMVLALQVIYACFLAQTSLLCWKRSRYGLFDFWCFLIRKIGLTVLRLDGSRIFLFLKNRIHFYH
ncbi:hypothetical protein BN873_p20005 [Candidatus Competibacter denitrificans Run_A_D11]|uniref:Uncharacterized protein n=1 Tax=Candidatus Competibacter denitrificans Run_A_D11 TaxID=1400863 RepID=W6MD53_9GAMM|nr:hypothetical protein BN873_p20005 [Candidatus Competibacter denitrificans Run_A_D11]